MCGYMSKRILQFTILFIIVFVIMLVPGLIESGIIPIKNKLVAYTLIFGFMLLVSIGVSIVFKKYNDIGNGRHKRDLYDDFIKDNTGDRIAYNLARAGVDRKNIVISELKKKLNINIKKDIYEINLLLSPRTALLSIKYDMDVFKSFDEDKKEAISKSILEASTEPKVLVMMDKASVYDKVITLYKSL